MTPPSGARRTRLLCESGVTHVPSLATPSLTPACGAWPSVLLSPEPPSSESVRLRTSLPETQLSAF